MRINFWDPNIGSLPRIGHFFGPQTPTPPLPGSQVFVESSSCEEVWQLLLAVPEYPAAHCHLRIQII